MLAVSSSSERRLNFGRQQRLTENVISSFHSFRYLMNFLLDATLGMLVIWLAVKLVSKLVEYKQWTLLMFGEYGERNVYSSYYSKRLYASCSTRGCSKHTGGRQGAEPTSPAATQPEEHSQ